MVTGYTKREGMNTINEETYFCNGNGEHLAKEIKLHLPDILSVETFYTILDFLDCTICPNCYKVLKIIRR